MNQHRATSASSNACLRWRVWQPRTRSSPAPSTATSRPSCARDFLRKDAVPIVVSKLKIHLATFNVLHGTATATQDISVAGSAGVLAVCLPVALLCNVSPKKIRDDIENYEKRWKLNSNLLVNYQLNITWTKVVQNLGFSDWSSVTYVLFSDQ